jgi:hypothetical protein
VPESQVLQDWRAMIGPLTAVPTFTLYFSRPLVTPEGGLILKGECFSDSLFSMRRNFCNSWDSETAIIHSTFGYIRSTNYSVLAGLRRKLLNVGTREFSVRVRELRIAMSVGWNIADLSISLALQGRSFSGTDSEQAHALNDWAIAVASAPMRRALRYIIRERALHQIEYPAGPLSQLAAERLLQATRCDELCSR